MVKDKLSRSRELAARVIFAALQILKEKGGQAPGRDVIAEVEKRVPLKVQIKHRDASASVQEVRQLMGLLQKDGDVGMFVSSSGFTPDAKAAARGSHVHVELIDLDRFIGLWQEFYQKLTDEDKALLPLAPIYFYAPSV
jgi:restriction system protein